MGVTFIIICRRCFRIRRIAAVMFGGIFGEPRVHRETAISDLKTRLKCNGDGDQPGCGHRGAFLYMTIPDFPEVTDEQYLVRAMEEASAPRRRRRWR